MRNRILFITRNTIPYVKELQPLTGSVAGCLLMQQLDYWFERFPDGFWKFLEPSNHLRYKSSDSWVEELGMTAEEFRTAFDKIGIRYKSKGQFDETEDKFKGKYYCSYLNRVENITYYFRNHELVDVALDALIFNNEQAVVVNREPRFTGNREPRFTGNRESQFLEMGKVDLQGIGNHDPDNTEITSTEITQTPLLPAISDASCSGSDSELVFPKQLIEEERNIIFGLIRHLQLDTQQNLLAELEGALSRPYTIKRTPMSFMEGMVKKEKQGKFILDLGVAVLANRNRKAKNLALTKPAELKTNQVACAKGEKFLSDKLKARLGKHSHDACEGRTSSPASL